MHVHVCMPAYPCFHVEYIGLAAGPSLRLESTIHHRPVVINTREGEVHTGWREVTMSNRSGPRIYVGVVKNATVTFVKVRAQVWSNHK